jgi:hypothetical protein
MSWRTVRDLVVELAFCFFAFFLFFLSLFLVFPDERIDAMFATFEEKAKDGKVSKADFPAVLSKQARSTGTEENKKKKKKKRKRKEKKNQL